MQHGVVSLNLGGDNGGWSQKTGYLADGEGFRESAAGTWKVDGGKGVVADGGVCQQEAKKTFEGGYSSGVTAMGKFLSSAMFEEDMHGAALNFF